MYGTTISITNDLFVCVFVHVIFTGKQSQAIFGMNTYISISDIGCVRLKLEVIQRSAEFKLEKFTVLNIGNKIFLQKFLFGNLKKKTTHF